MSKASGVVPDKFKKYIARAMDIVPVNEKIEKKTIKFFDEYGPIFHESIQKFNDLTGEVNETIDKFEERLENAKKGKDIDKDSKADEFAIEITMLLEVMNSYMKIMAPFMNISHKYMDMYTDLKDIYDFTNSRALKWQEKIMELYKDEPDERRPLIKSENK